jgi:uncharacterized membrane protein (GlpM family)
MLVDMKLYSSRLFFENVDQNKGRYLTILLASMALTALCIFKSVPVWYWPDLALLFFSIWAVINIHQSVSKGFWIPVLLLVYFFCFSPAAPDIDFTNSYLVPLKPFFYLIILYLTSAKEIKWDLRPFIYGGLYLYPLMILWNIALFYFRDHVFQMRPFFFTENNFEIPVYLTFFVIATFLYKDRDIKLFFITGLVILLTGSRSGVVGFMIIAAVYMLTAKLTLKRLIYSGACSVLVVAYIIATRVDKFQVNSFDRVQSFNSLFEFYNNSFLEVLKFPLGFGIYAKAPYSVCITYDKFADWFTGNPYNCDPLMLQAFFTRGLYEYGIYILAYIPLAFFFELKSRMGTQIALLTIIPIFTAALSVGGFSNGLAFWGVLLCLLAYRQVHDSSVPLNAVHRHYQSE